MEIFLENGVRKLVFNRPQRKNAMPRETYIELAKILNEDARNKDVIITIITGNGEYFSSGNDFNSSLINPDRGVVKDMIDAFIKYPKILIAVVNGPAIGIGATILMLCDIVYCSDRATFEIPFVRLGLSLEGCSSFMYSQVLGKSKAAEMLFLNHILTAEEALNRGFVAQIIPHEKLQAFIQTLYKFGTLPLNTVVRNKELFMKWSKNTLLECNKEESEVLEISVNSDEFYNAVHSFLQRKSKL